MPDPVLQPVPASDLPGDALREAFNAAFDDYLIGPPRLRAVDWPLFLRRQGIDLGASRVLADARGEVGAFAFIGRNGAMQRLATMGARPQARGTGAAQRLLDLVVHEARGRGAAGMELEVFVRNPRAVALYRSRGFEPLTELHGWLRPPGPLPAEEVGPDAEPIALDEALSQLVALRVTALPFQFTAGSVSTALPPLAAWRSGEALLVASLRDTTQIGVLSLVDTSHAQQGARCLARTLARRHPAATLKVPQLLSDELGGRALAAEGWQRDPLHQWLMRLPF